MTSHLVKGEMPPEQMMDAVHEIATKCKERNVRVIVDAESQHFQKAIDRVAIELMRKYNRNGHDLIYNTYQAYLKSTQANVANHLAEASKDGFTLGVKVVRGAYILSDPRHLIHDTKQDTDDTYDAVAQGIIKKDFRGIGAGTPGAPPFPSVKLFLASHNRASLMAALHLHRERNEKNLPTVPLKFGQLQGMSDEVSFSLLEKKGDGPNAPEIFKCSTWGTMSECIAYLLRRAVENRDAVLRTTDEYAAVKKECWRRMRTMFAA